MTIPSGEPPVSPTALWRLSACARLAGISPDSLEAAIREGRLPGVGLVELGKRRIKHVRRPDRFYAWIHGTDLDPADDTDSLFGPEPTPGIPMQRNPITFTS